MAHLEHALTVCPESLQPTIGAVDVREAGRGEISHCLVRGVSKEEVRQGYRSVVMLLYCYQ